MYFAFVQGKLRPGEIPMEVTKLKLLYICFQHDSRHLNKTSNCIYVNDDNFSYLILYVQTCY